MEQSMLSALYAYNTYANEIVLTTVSQLSEKEFTQRSSPSRDSVHVLLRHLLLTETFFLKRCQGQTPPAQLADRLLMLDDLQNYQQRLAHEQEEFILTLTDAERQREIDFQIGPQSLHLPMWQLLIQALVHSTHHRGELSIVLSQLGHPLPTLDIIIPFVEWSGQVWPGN